MCFFYFIFIELDVQIHFSTMDAILRSFTLCVHRFFYNGCCFIQSYIITCMCVFSSITESVSCNFTSHIHFFYFFLYIFLYISYGVELLFITCRVELFSVIFFLSFFFFFFGL